MKLAEKFKQKMREKKNFNKENKENEDVKVNTSPKELLSASKRPSIESPQSSDLSFVKIVRNKNLVRSSISQSQSQRLDFFEKDLEPVKLSFFKDLNEYEIVSRYYFPQNHEELDSLIAENNAGFPKFKLPHHRDLFNRGDEDDCSNLFTPANISVCGIHEKLVVFLYAYRNYIFSEYLSSSINRRRVMFIIEVNVLNNFYDCIKSHFENSHSKENQEPEITTQNKSRFIYKNKKKLERELEAEEIRNYLKRIRRTKRNFKNLKQRIEEIGNSNLRMASSEIAQELDTALQVTDLPEVDKYYIRIMKRKDKDFKQQLKELDDLKFKLRILDYGVLQLNSIENEKKQIVKQCDPTYEVLKKIGFHDLAKQLMNIHKKQLNLENN